jgi:hypothetical protein
MNALPQLQLPRHPESVNALKYRSNVRSADSKQPSPSILRREDRYIAAPAFWPARFQKARKPEIGQASPALPVKAPQFDKPAAPQARDATGLRRDMSRNTAPCRVYHHSTNPIGRYPLAKLWISGLRTPKSTSSEH